MRKLIVTAALAALFVPAASFSGSFWNPLPLDYEVIMIDNANAPMKISEAELKYDEKGFGLLSKDTGLYELWIKAKYENVSSKEVIATAFGGIVFDYFDDRIYAIDCHTTDKLKPGKGASGTWSFNFDDDFSTYTVIFYVRAVRFADETVWKADEDFVVSEINRMRNASFGREVLVFE